MLLPLLISEVPLFVHISELDLLQMCLQEENLIFSRSKAEKDMPQEHKWKEESKSQNDPVIINVINQ